MNRIHFSQQLGLTHDKTVDFMIVTFLPLLLIELPPLGFAACPNLIAPYMVIGNLRHLQRNLRKRMNALFFNIPTRQEYFRIWFPTIITRKLSHLLGVTFLCPLRNICRLLGLHEDYETISKRIRMHINNN